MIWLDLDVVFHNVKGLVVDFVGEPDRKQDHEKNEHYETVRVCVVQSKTVRQDASNL